MEKSCSLLVHFNKGTLALANEIKKAFEGNDVPAKIDAMKNAIMLLLNEEAEVTGSTKKSQQANSIIVSSKRPAILANGTYATQSAASETTFSPHTIVQG
ncbi:unnamed protein product [Fraxinus pennsylvanica]|uniref:Uncharacterized protein n=1 Tax=Fraxinus pennsylvanica TaxID=56036 RepID=A0AAD1ZS73_9LAMI|nr:unnamed protein product [Fraxinus pennsylvanica]